MPGRAASASFNDMTGVAWSREVGWAEALLSLPWQAFAG